MLGYQIEVDGMLGEWQRGPQPYEGILSTICESFGCLPRAGGAVDQNWREIKGVLEYRTARAAVDAFEDRKNGMATMARNPQLLEMLRDMVRAQTGTDEAGIDATLAAMTPTGDEDDGDA